MAGIVKRPVLTGFVATNDDPEGGGVEGRSKPGRDWRPLDNVGRNLIYTWEAGAGMRG